MMDDNWILVFIAQVQEATLRSGTFPVVHIRQEEPSHEELVEALRRARQVNRKIITVEHERDRSLGPRAVSRISAVTGAFDPNPPPFLEQYPIPIEI